MLFQPFRTQTQARWSSAFLLILLGTATNALAQDTEEIFLVRTQLFDQPAPYLVSLSEEGGNGFEMGPFSFDASAVSADEGLIKAGTFTRPGSLAVPLGENADGDEWSFVESFELFHELNSNYPTDTYTVSLDTTNDGLKMVPIDLPDSDYTAITAFSNFEAAQAIDPTQPFVFKWDAIMGGTTEDILDFEVRDEDDNTVFYYGDLETEGPLTGLTTQVTLPGDSLESGKQYFAYLATYRLVEPDSDAAYPGVFYGSADSKLLRMPIQSTGAIPDDEIPTMDQSNPYWGQDGVPRDTAVGFQFNESMDSAVTVDEAISWTGINPSLMTYTWNPTGDILFCHYQTALPAFTEISWVFNPMGSAAQLRDEAGNPLDQTEGSFTTTAQDPSGDSGVEEMVIAKVHLFFQEEDTPTELLYAAEHYVDMNRAGAVISADLEIPTRGTALNVSSFLEFSDFRELEAEAIFAEASDLEVIFPGGEYNSVLHGASGTAPIEVSLSFGTDDQYPNAPTLQGLSALQTIDPNQPLTLSWGAMAGGTANDIIVVEVEGESACYFESPDLGEAGVLDGTATSITIPAGTLPPGRSLEAEVVFIRILDQDESVSFPTYALIASVTVFEMQTTGDPEVPVNLMLAQTGGQIALSVKGEVGFTYVIQATEVLNDDPDTWSDLRYEYIPDDCDGFLGTVEFIDQDAGNFAKRFYRVLQMPNE